MHQALLENNFLQFTVYAFVSLGSIAIDGMTQRNPLKNCHNATMVISHPQGRGPLGMEEGFVKLL